MNKTKREFLNNLDGELNRHGVLAGDKGEIIADFEQHFTDSLAEGLTEEEICEKLGDVSEIARQYSDGGGAWNSGSGATPLYEQFKDSFRNNNNGGGFNASGLVVVLLIDIFVLSWAIPALFSVVFALLAVPFALIVSGIVTLIGGIFGSVIGFFSPLPVVATLFLAIMLMSLGGLAILAGIQLVKLFIKFMRIVIDWHGNMIVGRPVFLKKEVSA